MTTLKRNALMCLGCIPSKKDVGLGMHDMRCLVLVASHAQGLSMA